MPSLVMTMLSGNSVPSTITLSKPAPPSIETGAFTLYWTVSLPSPGLTVVIACVETVSSGTAAPAAVDVDGVVDWLDFRRPVVVGRGVGFRRRVAGRARLVQAAVKQRHEGRCLGRLVGDEAGATKQEDVVRRAGGRDRRLGREDL